MKYALQTKHYVMLLIVVAISILSFIYWRYTVVYPATDDAYVGANIVEIASEINGQVSAIAVSNNQAVKKGDLLFSLDQTPYKIAVDQAAAQLQLAKQQVSAANDAIQVSISMVNQRSAELTRNQHNYDRVMALLAKGVYSKAQADEAIAQLKVSQAELKSAQEQLKQAQDNLGNSDQNNAQVKAAQAALDKAQYDLDHTQILAPANGTVTNLTLRKGNVISAGQPQFAFIENNEWWVDANFKETQLQRIQPGQTATITLDMYPQHKIKGIVESISRGSGSAFSLLPPENATGNWIKVTQRFPIRIKLQNVADDHFPLRVGSSSFVTVDTKSKS
jgi:membrane fusion protein (multidrug efflux system)